MAYAKKRFIAGANCPGCGQFDTVYTLVPGVDGSSTSRHCSRCDFVALLNLERDLERDSEKALEVGANIGADIDTDGQWQVINLQPQNSDKS